ncbi:hypothetical protein MMC13_005917 [Lambiella insularis]|nr:hypothetical protein [Lambiella insularis]
MRAAASTPSAVGFVKRISELKAKFENFLLLDGPRSACELEEYVSECFSITTSNGRVPFRTVLREVGLDCHEWFNNKFIMQIDKLGAYHRNPETLSREARGRGTRPLFSNIKLEYIDPYGPGQSSISLDGRTVYCHVHAEVQMAIHYILKRVSLSPRFIGTSKAACFLCHLFITCHNVFTVSAWHGRLYDQWTIPDLADYSSENVTALKAIIQQMQLECARLISRKHSWRPYPLTSRHNLQDLPAFSPASTISSMKHDLPQSPSRSIFTVAEGAEVSSLACPVSQSPTLSIAPGPAGTDSPSATDGSTTPKQSNPAVESEVVVKSNGARHSAPKYHGLSDGSLRTRSTASISSTGSLHSVHLHPGRPRVIKFPNVKLIAEIESPCVGMLTFDGCNEVSLDSGSRVVNLEDPKEGDETSFKKRDSDTSILLLFHKSGINECCVALAWK